MPGRVLTTVLQIQVLYVFDETGCALPVSDLGTSAAPVDEVALLAKIVLADVPNRTL